MTGNSRNRRNKCDLYLPGHCVHWIQSRKASEVTPRCGTLVEVTDTVITVEYLDKVGHYRNHDAGRILKVAKPGTKVRVSEDYGLLGVDMDHYTYRCFCIADTDRPWTSCSYEPMVATTPEALAERLASRGGFSVSGRVVKGWSK